MLQEHLACPLSNSVDIWGLRDKRRYDQHYGEVIVRT
jgi:hypothetical protein